MVHTMLSAGDAALFETLPGEGAGQNGVVLHGDSEKAAAWQVKHEHPVTKGTSTISHCVFEMASWKSCRSEPHFPSL